MMLLCLAGRARASAGGIEGVLFYDRGHFWIELSFRDGGARAEAPPEPEPADFTIVNLRAGSRPFRPSGVEIVGLADGGSVIVLKSSKFKPRSCYRITYRAGDGTDLVAASVCDPFSAVPGSRECSSKGFFRRYIAPAFSRSGECYNLNRFKFEYDLSAEESSSDIVIQPRFEAGGLTIEPSLEHRETTYDLGGSRGTRAAEREFALTLERLSWVGELGFLFSGGYRHERASLQSGSADSTVYSHSLVVEGYVRLDNLFDSVNRYCISVFKGVDVGFGYAWYASNNEEIWGTTDFDRITPFLKARMTWTLLYGFQFSYSLESYWPSSLGDRFEEFHSLRLRLLLRDVLAGYARRHYHPDLEIALDTGRRLPLFEEEEKVSVGFTFDLFPW